MERETCIRCGGRMTCLGRQDLQKGAPGWHLRGDFERIGREDVLPVEAWVCGGCGRLEFYLAQMAAPEEPSGIARTPCPFCGQLHEMDDARCPHCGKRLY